MKKKVLIICGLLIVLIFFILLLIKIYTIKNIQEFSISQYKDEIKKFSYNMSVGNIDNAEEAKNIAENLWTKEYGVKVKDKKPYIVYYDSTSKVWLVQGSLPNETVGGVPYIIMREIDGKVLALWHDK